METKQIEKMTDEEYFALKAISASQLKQYDKGAYWFWKTSPFNPEKGPEEESDALAFGKLCHCVLLEPEALKERYEVVDFGKSRSNKKYAEAKEQFPGKLIINQEEADRAFKMYAEIKQHRLASAILDGATAEMPYVWTDGETGLPCKCKIDAIKRTRAGLVVIDYKTARSITDVIKYAQKTQYAIQAEFYKMAVKEKYGEEPVEFVFIIQSNQPGEEDVVCVANVEQETQDIAKTIMRSHMESIKYKLENWEKTHDKTIWAAYPEREFIRYSNYYLTNGEYW